jgi:hypothetical protein
VTRLPCNFIGRLIVERNNIGILIPVNIQLGFHYTLQIEFIFNLAGTYQLRWNNGSVSTTRSRGSAEPTGSIFGFPFVVHGQWSRVCCTLLQDY